MPPKVFLNFWGHAVTYRVFYVVSLETSVLQQCVNLWLASAEIAVHCHTVINTAGGEDILAELLGNLLVEYVASLLECLESIGIEDRKSVV